MEGCTNPINVVIVLKRQTRAFPKQALAVREVLRSRHSSSLEEPLLITSNRRIDVRVRCEVQIEKPLALCQGSSGSGSGSGWMLILGSEGMDWD
jgi:hypothetical protein